MPKKRTKNYIGHILNNITYPLIASMARRRFWMINNLFPLSPNHKRLRQEIYSANEKDKKIIDVGCGDSAQALRDLYNNGVRNLYGLDLEPPKRKKKGIKIIKGDVCRIDLEDNFIDGVLYSAYLIMHLSPEDQILALSELNRITKKSAVGFIGPLNPQSINKEDRKKMGEFGDFKNPYFGFVKKMNDSGNGKWTLSRTLITNLTFYSKSNRIHKFAYRAVIPFYMFYFLTGRAMLNRILPNLKVKKDFTERLPFEYFITFKK